jgi:hypothetical protein
MHVVLLVSAGWAHIAFEKCRNASRGGKKNDQKGYAFYIE